ncbi:MAG: hypothetical protein KatS3mg077_0886 [Candidatus Binatia bacterium]|nr:MAG: hypothetical protein KatS3mg077_0886 [Candidatus Binatia bacterium]
MPLPRTHRSASQRPAWRRWLGAALTLAIAWGCERPSGEPPTAPSASATTARNEHAVFESWLEYEPSQRQHDPEWRDGYLDALLGHQVFQVPPSGVPRSVAQGLMLDDDKVLLASGPKLWAQDLEFVPGFAGKVCFLHSFFCFKELFRVSFAVDDVPVPLFEDQFHISRYPSHTLIQYYLGPVVVQERKFITAGDRAVAVYSAASRDKREHKLHIEADVAFLPMPNATRPPKVPLLGSGVFQQISIFAYLDAPGFDLEGHARVRASRELRLPADGTSRDAVIAVSFESAERRAAPDLDPSIFEVHRREYQKWFADNVPYFDCSDEGFKRMWYYRAWLVRFNMTEADTPDLTRYRFYEGKLGFDNAITFAVPVQLKELTYLRDPAFARSQVRNAYRNLAPSGALVDPPGSPYWNETYSHWVAAAVEELHRVHPFTIAELRELLPQMARDVRAWVTALDPDGDGLPQSGRPRITGYDLDILSYWFFNGLRLHPRLNPPELERVDFASFVYANAKAIAALAATAGEPPLEREFQAVAGRLRATALEAFWDDDSAFFYPRRADNNARIPIRELHGFFPFLVGLAPDEPRYRRALRYLVDPQEFWGRFPPVITSQAHYREWTWEMDGLTRNIAPHPISMGARLLLQVLRNYHDHPVTPDHFMELMQRYNELVYPGVNPYDPYWRPNAHEYYSQWEPYRMSPRPKPSDISHDFHSMYLSLIVEGAVGLVPRADDWIELDPMARHWDRFLLHRLRYRGHELTIVWDRPDGQRAYPQFEEGFTLLVDSRPAFRRTELAHVSYNLTTKELREGAP